MLKPTAVVAACVAVLLVASACTHDSPKPNYSTVSTSPSTTTSPATPVATPNTTVNVPPGAEKPNLPSVSSTNTPDGAFSFAPYYWKMVSWAYATNDSSVISGLYASTCASCASFRKSIADNVAYGYVLHGGLIQIDAVNVSSSLDNTAGAQYAIDCALTIADLTVEDSAGKVIQTYPGTTDRQRMYLAWSAERWQVVDTAQVTG